MLALLFCALFAGAAKPVHPFLYRVTAGERVSYLLGTVHSHLVQVDDFDESLRRALTTVDAVYYENDDPAQSERDVQMISRMPPKFPPWSQVLPPEPLDRLRALLASIGRGDLFVGFDNLQPGAAFFMVAALAQTRAAQAGAGPKPFAIDSQLVSREADRRLIPLNDVRDNFRLLSAVITDEAYADLLTTYFDSEGNYVLPEEELAQMQRRTERYLRGDPAEPPPDDPRPLYLAHRAFHEAQSLNHLQWYPLILAGMRRGSVLVNVGVDRLTNPGALLDRLSKEKGVRIERLWTCRADL